MAWLIPIVLFLHIGGAILAFGPTFAFPLMASMAAKEPQHLNFALRAQKKIASTLVTPLAIFQGITGFVLVALIGFQILTRGWLLVSIVLYAAALIISFVVLYPSMRILIAATSAPPPAPAEGSAAPAGPPPHVIAARDRARLGGMVTSVLILTIVLLMVTKPF